MKQTQDGYIRDQNNPGAVINTDNSALKAYKSRKAKAKQADQTTQDVIQLKSEMADIKNMLSQILEKLSK